MLFYTHLPLYKEPPDYSVNSQNNELLTKKWDESNPLIWRDAYISFKLTYVMQATISLITPWRENCLLYETSLANVCHGFCCISLERKKAS